MKSLHGFNASHLGGQLLLLLQLVILHEWESKDLTNGVVVSQEHDHSVNTHTPATGRRQTVLERGTEVLIDKLSLVVTLVLLAGLLLETQALVEGIVQLGVSVGDLLLAHESLESLAQTGDLTVVLGERAHDLRVASDERRVDTLLLDELANQLVNHAGVSQRRCALQVHLLKDILEELVGLLSVELVTRRKLLASSLLKSGDHLISGPRRLPVDLVLLATLSMESSLVATGLGSGTTSNLVHHGSLNLDEVTLVEVFADPGDHLRSSDEDVTGLLVADEIEVSLTVSLLEILEAVVVIGKGMQARSQENNFGGENGQLTLLTLLDLGLGCSSRMISFINLPARVSDNSDDITSAKVLVLVLKRGSSLTNLLSLAHDLDLDTLSSDIVEEELGARCSLSVDTGTNLNDLVLGVLARLEVTKLLDELSQVVCNIELVGVGVGALGLAELVDVPGSDLEVLVGGEVLLRSLSTTGSLLGSGSGTTLGSLLLLFLLLLAGLLALLQLGLGDLLTSYLIEVQVGNLLGRGGSSVSHNCVSFSRLWN
ncbi:unnamed protein product [Fusarium graminearum]|nr:unnamed protein product [Fusarium graminearum]